MAILRQSDVLEFRGQHTLLSSGLFLHGRRIAWLTPGTRLDQSQATSLYEAWKARGSSTPLGRSASSTIINGST